MEKNYSEKIKDWIIDEIELIDHIEISKGLKIVLTQEIKGCLCGSEITNFMDIPVYVNTGIENNKVIIVYKDETNFLISL